MKWLVPYDRVAAHLQGSMQKWVMQPFEHAHITVLNKRKAQSLRTPDKER